MILDFLRPSRRAKRPASASPPATTAASTPLAPESEAAYKPLDWKVVRGILRWMQPFWPGYVITAIIGLLVNLCEMITPRYMQQLIDTDIPGKKPNLQISIIGKILHSMNPRWAADIQTLSHVHRAYLNIVATIAVWALTMGIGLLLQRWGIVNTSRIGEKVLFALRKRVFAHLQALSMSYYDKTKFGRILTRGTSDIDAMFNTIVWGVNSLLSNALMMIIAAVILLLMDWRIALAVLWLGPVLYALNIFYRRRVGAAWRRVREGFTQVSSNLAENISGMRVVAAFNRQHQNLDVFNSLQVINTSNNVRAAVVNGIYQPLLGLLGFLGKVIILIFGSYMVFHTAAHASSRPFTIGELVAMFIYWDWFMGPVINFGNFYNDTMMAMACAERVQNLLAQQPEVQDSPQAVVLPPVRGEVQFDHVTFSYKPGTPVLQDVDFHIEPGQMVALVGHTGCGKSTIISLICRFYTAQQGRVLIDGHDLRDITGESLHHQMGIVVQNNFLFSGTVMDNIRFARPEATDEEVYAATKSLDCYDMIMELKDGFQTTVGERGASVSLGQRQLICFARAFVANPRILLLDEATSAVDTHTEVLIQQALERLTAHRTTFVVAHRLSTIIHADVLMVLDHGRIIERGTHQSLLAANGRYANLYREFTRAS